MSGIIQYTTAAALLLAIPCASAQTPPWVGLSAKGAQLHLDSVLGSHGPNEGDHFGHSVAAGDFNNDGYDDLVVGIPFDACSSDGAPICGSVQVRFGWSTGALGAALILDPAAPGAPVPPSSYAQYGRALAVGDFDNDGYDDLAVGEPEYNWGAYNAQGIVQLHFGLPGDQGSIQWAAQHWVLNSSALGGYPYQGERFGAAIATGDFNGDGRDELAVGAPQNYDFDSGERPGSVTVLDVSRGQPMVGGFEMTLGLSGLPDTPEHGEQFGASLASGDFNCDSYDDLAIGVPEEDGIGAVLVVYGSPNSLIFANHWYFSQWDLNQTINFSSKFGYALAAGDFDDSGCDDLAIGAPYFDGEGEAYTDMGIVAVVYGAPGGLSAFGREFLWEDSLYGVPGSSENGDRFGFALTADDFDGDGVDDLAIGTPGQDGVSGSSDSGSVTVVLGNRQRGLGPGRRLQPGNPPRYLIPDPSALPANYGYSLASGDFDGNGYGDLAIGAPLRSIPEGSVEAGAAAVVYGRERSLFEHGFELPPAL